MVTASVSEAKNRLSALLDRVKRGESVLILDRQTPVALLNPVGQATGPDREKEALQRLAREGLVRLPKRRPDASVLKLPLPRADKSVLAALLEERREGR